MNNQQPTASTQPVRVLAVLNSLAPGGTEQSTVVLAPRLRDHGVEVSIVTLRSAEHQLDDIARQAGIDVLRLAPGRFPTQLRQLRHVIREVKPDIVHTALFDADVLGRLAAWRTGVPVVSSLVNTPYDPGRLGDPNVKRWRLRAVQVVDSVTGRLFVRRFHSVSEGVKSANAHALRLKPQKIAVAERGRDTSALGERTPERRARVRETLGIVHTAPVVLNLGRLEHQKAQVDLIAAAAHLWSQQPELVVLIAGKDGSASGRVHAALDDDPATAEHVQLLGHRTDVGDLLSAADVLVISSHFEGTAGVALEAMAVGTPIVSSDLEGLVGVLTHGENALLVERNNPALLAEAIGRVLADQDLATRLAERGKADFAERFTLDAGAARLAGLYREVAGKQELPMSKRPLVIVDRLPLPAVTGGRQRMWNYLQAVAALGPADLVLLGSADETTDEWTETQRSLPSWTLTSIPPPRSRPHLVVRVGRTLCGRRLSGHHQPALDAVAAALKQHLTCRRPVIAIQATAASVAITIRERCAPLIVDLWDVEDVRLRREIDARGRPRLRPRPLWREVRERSDVRAWRRFHRELLETCDALSVCSEVDRQAMPSPADVWVVPNGADIPKVAPTHQERDPVLLFHGQLGYPPNADAAQLLASEILPLVRQAVPAARLRIVGQAGPKVLALNDLPGVTVTGFVENIEPELEMAAVAVVPLRVGGGTRLKILEAFAHGLPVVSTTIGAEGLNVEAGKHLLIADTTSDIAEAIVHMLQDAETRNRLVDAAFSFVREQYDWTRIRADLTSKIGQLIQAAVDGEIPATSA